VSTFRPAASTAGRFADARQGGIAVVTDTDARRFADDPAGFFGHSYQAMHTLPRAELESLQLAGVRARFGELRDRVVVLAGVADDQRASGIGTLDDVVPLLFPHTVYKSYPASLVLNARFDRLTAWLDRLTTRDLSGVEVGGCEGIDEWLAALEARTDLRPVHSSGTTGTMSFLPRTAGEADRMFATSRLGLLPGVDPRIDPAIDAAGPGNDPTGSRGLGNARRTPVIWPAFRYGSSAIMRFANQLATHVTGGEDGFHALHPGRMSSDVLFLAGRLRAALARGESGEADVRPALRERSAEFEQARHDMAAGLPGFLAGLVERLQGERVLMMGSWTVVHQLALAAGQQGLSAVFAADSSVVGGGGAKGMELPPGWEQSIERFTGVPRLRHCYAMSEVMATHMMCPNGRYHVEPSTVLYLLDPEDGTPLPREGVRTGRAAFFDLLADTYWGGFVTGDEVTVHWAPCACGLTSPQVGRAIERYSALAGGDDKISCAATESAHREALDFLTSVSG
jgi:hypothetical protein